MCGIVGIFETRSLREVSRATLARMNDSQRHRGPDDSGYFVEPGIGLGHRRLSIIDLSTGHQPLFNEDGSVLVIFNGEIYNFQELIPELVALGHVFRTKSDTEVIVHAWEAWGETCVTRFRGMFAFALWDRNKQTLFLARDRLGVKPLYYAFLPDGKFIFGSELKSLVAHGEWSRELEDALGREDASQRVLGLYQNMPLATFDPPDLVGRIWLTQESKTVTDAAVSGEKDRFVMSEVTALTPVRLVGGDELHIALEDKDAHGNDKLGEVILDRATLIDALDRGRETVVPVHAQGAGSVLFVVLRVTER